ncbi:hypothetical protein MKW94_019236 [Papaver nudicaule]|uniref:Uncharacterized protein n=1 Tax=Papaver nudicaule TaxID=74823 RepID=A0AA41W1P7_PAPNU|nr:hypothetical protein [Papaver nudicaule]
MSSLGQVSDEIVGVYYVYFSPVCLAITIFHLCVWQLRAWQFPEGENSITASTANDLRTDKYSIYGDTEKLKAVAAGLSQIGASFAIATAVVFGGAALAFGITASKLDIHNSEDIKTKGRDLLHPKFDGVRDQLVPIRVWAENKSSGWRIGMDKQGKENRLIKELSKNLGVKDSS